MKVSFLQTDKTESVKSWWFRTLMNWYPMYFGTGGKIVFWSADSHEAHVRLRLNLWTYNYVGTIFGGSMFSASDPFYMVMLLKVLGPDYVVWDKSASIRFRKPGRSSLYARYLLTAADIEAIKSGVKQGGEFHRNFVIQWVDAKGVVHAEIERLCYIADKTWYEKKKGESQRTRLE
ncbi:MAG: DUF4442 domain-containing protein [Cyclobacteriaceae bacterium]